MLNNLTLHSNYLAIFRFVFRRLFGIVMMLFVIAISISAQTATDGKTPLGTAPGSPAGSYALSGFDNVNLYNGNLNFHLPLLGITGRGEAQMTMQLSLNLKGWRVRHTNPSGIHDNYLPVPPASWWSGNLASGSYGPGKLEERQSGTGFTDCSSYPGGNTNAFGRTITRLTFVESDGSEHQLIDQLTGGQPLGSYPNLCSSVTGASRGAVFISHEGEAMTFISDTVIYDRNTSGGSTLYPSGYLMLRNGTRYRIDNGTVTWLRDRNGNRLTFSYDTTLQPTVITDSLNRQVTIAYNFADVAPYGVCDRITFTGFGGAPRIIRVSRTNLSSVLRQASSYSNHPAAYTIQTYQQLFPELNAFPPGSYNPGGIVSAVWLPDGVRRFQLYYNSYGELARVELPTGGAVEYDTTPGSGVISGDSLYNDDYLQIYRRVIERRVYSDGVSLESKQTYSANYSNSEDPTPWTTTVTVDNVSPGGALLAREKHYFYGSGAASLFRQSDPTNQHLYSAWKEGKENQTETFNTNGGTILRRVVNTFAQRAPVNWWGWGADDAPANDPRLTQVISTLVDTNQVAQQTFSYDQYNNRTDQYEHDFGIGTPGGRLRHTHTDYLTTANYTDALSGAHLRSLPTASRVYAVNPVNGAETLAAQSTTAYDELSILPYGSVTGWADPGTTARGNVTSTGKWLDTTGAYVQTRVQYDQCGNVRKTWDARDTGLTNPTQIGYSDAFSDGVPRNTYAFPTNVTTAVPDSSGIYASNVALTTTSVYDFNTGKVVSATDANAKTTSYDYSDPLDRLKQVTLPDGGRTTYTYVDAHQCGPYVETRSLLDSTGREADSYQFFDGLGRSKRTFSYENQDTSNPYLTVDTQYDSLGRAWRVSSPYRSSGCTATINPLGRWTTTGFDALSRVVSVTTPDGAVVSTAYSGNTVTVTDQAGKTRRSVTDALGRLARVDEPDSSGNLGSTSAPTQPTNYTYDVLDNLRRVDQGSQQRFFMYDSLSRLIRAKNPEQAANSAIAITDSITGNSQWSMGYSYDNNGNLSTRIDARNVTTTFAYDALNRNTTLRYTDGTRDIDRHYDNPTANKNGLGRFWYSNWDQNTNTRFDSHLAIDQYDALGRPSNYRQHFFTNGVASPQFNVTRSYDKAGHVLTQSYPSGRSVTYGYDIAGRLNSDTGNLGDGVARTYSTAVTYSEFGGLQQEQFGTQTALYHKLHYNVRGQLYDVRLSSVAWASDQWDWNRGAVVNYFAQNYQWQVSDPYNNGNLLRSEHSIPLDANGTYGSGSAGPYATSVDTYSYDTLNRLASVQESKYQSGGSLTPAFTQTYTYDRWGNRTINQSQTSANVPHPNYTADTSSNRLIAPAGYNYAYDSAGNQTNDNYTGQGQRTYDGENRMKQAQGTPNGQWQTYTYDADGRRIKRNVNGVETWAIYGMDGELLAEYASGAAPFLPTTEYGYRNGQLLVTITNGDTQRLNRFVTNLYYGALQRDPTSQELTDKVNQLAAAGAVSQAQLQTVASQIARSLFTSTNYETSPYRSDTQYVADLYYAYLQRAADDGGLGWWAGQVPGSGRANVCNAFEASGEFQTLVANLYGTAASDNERTEHFVNDFYLGAYGRNATSTELQQQRDALNTAAAQGQVQVQTQAETFGRSLFVGQVNDTSLSNTQYVTNLYEAFLQRGPDAGGLSWWSGQASVGQGRQNVLNAFAACSAFRELSGTLYREANWLVADHLGTPRMIVNKSGSLASVKRHDYLPFGEELSAGIGGRTTTQGYTGDSVRQKFTSKEWDTETGLDYFGARYYASTQGRFTSPDPLHSSGRPIHPQSWNRYSYVINQPLSLIDPDGLDWGVANWTDKDGVRHTDYHYFRGEIGDWGGHTYSAVNFGNDATRTLDLSDGRTVAISNDPGALNGAYMRDVTIHAQTKTLPVLDPSWVDYVPVASNARSFLFHYGTHNFEAALLDFGLASAELGTANVGASAAAAKSLATEGGEAIFFSGGKAAFQAATQAAKSEGGTLITQTVGGRALNVIAPRSSPSFWRDPIWNWGSKHFAEGASGNVRVFLREPIRSRSTWNTVENPILRVNPFVRIVQR